MAGVSGTDGSGTNVPHPSSSIGEGEFVVVEREEEVSDNDFDVVPDYETNLNIPGLTNEPRAAGTPADGAPFVPGTFEAVG